MPGLFSTLTTTANAMAVFEQALNTVGNNVVNEGTPGYARQDFSVVAQPFDPSEGLPGGIAAGEIQNSRDIYAEQTVWTDNQSFGNADQSVTELTNVQPLFNVTGSSGIPAALNAFFQSFSALSVSPNDSVARNDVLSSAQQLAGQINAAATGLSNASLNLNTEISSAAGTINSLTQQIATLNSQIQGNVQNQSDPSVDASMYNDLENLSEYVNFTAMRQPNGSMTVLLDGQTPLVMGDTQYAIQASGASGTAVVQDSEGNDITAQVTGGRLNALVNMKNNVIAGYTDSLNQLAASVSDTVNNALLNGVDQNGNDGAQLFSYDNASDAASTMQVTGITTDELAAALPSAPGGNGNALNLVALANSPEINGMTFTQYYSSVATQVGQALDTAQQNQTTSQDMLDQARTVRSNIEGVSLDSEATEMIEYQRAYQATAHVVTILNSLTDTLMNMVQGG
jgi:flagellar hook-associated protein 1 FlgK